MDSFTAKPNLLKQTNLSFIRKVIKKKSAATRAQIAYETGISPTSIRTLLFEMMQNGEIEMVGHGTRKAEQYRFKPGRFFSVAFCITDHQIYSLLVNIHGQIIETTELSAADGNIESVVIPFLDRLIQQREIKCIGIGVPGAVEGGGYWRTNKQDNELRKVDIGGTLVQRYGIPVILENDLNAAAIGFERSYAKEFPCDDPKNTNMAYLYFEKGCVSAGFISGGRVIRGYNHFAGELSLIPIENEKLLDDFICEASTDMQYVDLVVKVAAWICGILNPQYIVLSGPNLRKDCVGPIGDGLFAVLPKQLFAEILYSADLWHDYREGVAYLTAENMFEEAGIIGQ